MISSIFYNSVSSCSRISICNEKNIKHKQKMDNNIFPLIRNKCPQDADTVNKLLVSAFVLVKKIKLKKNSFLKNYLISKEDDKLTEFVKILKTHNCKFRFEDLIELFECVLSPQEKVVNGAVYTPKFIRDYIVEQVFKNRTTQEIRKAKIADISCGCGAFLLTAAQLIHEKTGKKYKEIVEENLFGFDIADYALERTKILLSFLLLEEKEEDNCLFDNLQQVDSLTYPFKKYFSKGFDIIIGNPPYVCSRKMSDSVRLSLKRWSTCQIGHPDLYIPFFQIALENLAKNGVAGYITVNSFFKSLNGRKLRQYFHEGNRKLDVIDFGYSSVFKDKQVYTCLCFFSNQKQKSIQYKLIEPADLDKGVTFQQVAYDSLDFHAGWNLNEHSLMNYFESFPNKLGNLCSSRHGIATLKNSVYIFKPKKETLKHYVLEKNDRQYQVEKAVCKKIINSNKITPESNINQLQEVAIFPYKKTKQNTVVVLTERELKNKYKKAYEYLLTQKALLSTRDKGKTNDYPSWFAYGRTQSLNITDSYKLFFPKIARNQPNCILSQDRDLLFYNGQALISSDIEMLKFLKKILESSVFGLYIKLTSKPYSSGYYSLNGNYIKNFSIPDEVISKKDWMIEQDEQGVIDLFLEKVYSQMLERTKQVQLSQLLATLKSKI